MAGGETERVTMVWPKELKDQVRDASGKQSMTEFIIDAVEVHLKQAPDLDESTRRLNEAQFTAQLLADRLVMGGDSGDRLQSLMEVEFPSWIDTTGWPPTYAELVHKGDNPPLATETSAGTDESRQATDPVPAAQSPADVASAEDLEPQQQDVVASEAPGEEEAPGRVSVLPVEPPLNGEDLFVRVMKQTGQDLSGVPGLKPASKIAKPAPKETVHNHSWVRDDAGVLACECSAYIQEDHEDHPNGIVREPGEGPQRNRAGMSHEQAQAILAVLAPVEEKDMCPTCKEERIDDGECWTCD